MSITEANIETLFNTYIGDSSTNRISAAERLQFISEATTWLYEELGNEHSNNTYELSYIDGVHYYKVTAVLADLLIGADLRRSEFLHNVSFTRKSPRELAEEIGQGVDDPSWAIERRDGNSYLVVNFTPIHQMNVIDGMDTLSNWVVDSSGSDATNLTVDVNEYKHGTGSLNFDVSVSQSVNNKATIYNPSIGGLDLSSVEDLGTFRVWVYVPENQYVSSITLTWGSETSKTPSTKTKYWSATATTDINGSAITDGWNEMTFAWSSATKTSTPDSSDINYVQLDVNYSASQVDDTDFRFDFLTVTQPEKLIFHYISSYVGTSNGGTDLFAFTATTDVPFFSGQYDNYKYVVAHKAASLCFYGSLRLPNEGASEESEAIKALNRYRKTFESSKVREEKSFKVRGVNLRKRVR